MRYKRNFSLILFLVSIIVLNIPITYSAPQLDYFPNGEWRVSTPEEQGINNPNKLDEVYTRIIKYDIGIDSIVIVCNPLLKALQAF
jgi:hypothetical protein